MEAYIERFSLFVYINFVPALMEESMIDVISLRHRRWRSQAFPKQTRPVQARTASWTAWTHGSWNTSSLQAHPHNVELVVFPLRMVPQYFIRQEKSKYVQWSKYHPLNLLTERLGTNTPHMRMLNYAMDLNFKKISGLWLKFKQTNVDKILICNRI